MGRRGALEHPDSAKSWGNAKLKYRLNTSGSYAARFDQRRFGLVSNVSCTTMWERTRDATNRLLLRARAHLELCDHTHEHVPALGFESGERRSVLGPALSASPL